jgi:hypothetical protein
MMKRRGWTAGPLLILILASACASAEPAEPALPADAAAVARAVVLCSTTLEELRAQLGEPTRDGLLHRVRVVSWIANWDSPTKYLAVMLDERGVVVDLYWDIPTEIPWTPRDQCRRD